MLLVGLLLIFGPAALSAQEKNAAEERQHGRDVAEATSDRIIKPAMQEKRLPGLVLGVVKNGEVVVKKGYGVKSLESGEAPDENTVFLIASLSKALTAVGAMLLVQKEGLNLDAPASTYLKGLPEGWRPITVRQFMAHQSGIPQLNKKLPTFQQMLRLADGVPLRFAPGTDQEYNNFNFVVVGKVIEAVSHMSYLDYMKRNVFGPLRMDHTGARVASRHVATAYRPIGGRLKPTEHRIRSGAYGIPSGHLRSTLSDLLKLYEALHIGKLLKPAAYKEMVTRVNPGLSATPGWFERRAGQYSVVSKDGASQGFYSLMSFVSGKGDAVVMLWTSEKPKGNGLFKVRSQLLNQVCNIDMQIQTGPTDAPEDD